MTDISNATPRPWEVERHDQDDGSISCEIWCQTAPVYHRVVTLNDDDNEHARSDAALIVKAVNERDELIAALRDSRRSLAQIGAMCGNPNAIEACRLIVNRAKQASAEIETTLARAESSDAQ